MLGVGGDLFAKLTFDKEHQEERRQGDGSIQHAIGGVARVRQPKECGEKSFDSNFILRVFFMA